MFGIDYHTTPEGMETCKCEGIKDVVEKTPYMEGFIDVCPVCKKMIRDTYRSAIDDLEENGYDNYLW